MARVVHGTHRTHDVSPDLDNHLPQLVSLRSLLVVEQEIADVACLELVCEDEKLAETRPMLVIGGGASFLPP